MPDKPTSHDAPVAFDSPSDEPIGPLPLNGAAVDEPRAALGEALFAEPLLSADGRVACSSCHLEHHALADAEPHSHADGRPATELNTPTMFNVRYLSKLSWTGKFESLETQLDALFSNQKVMGSSWAAAAERLASMPIYRARFEAVFHGPPSASNVRSAVLEYERSLVTPNAPFDRYLRGDQQAISSDAKNGYRIFKSYGCASCHQGVAIGGNVYERFGAVRDVFADRGRSELADFGRFNVTGRERDRFVFRVPGLRNVALTAPYFHDGSAATLEDAVSDMARYQLGRELEPSEIGFLVAFLRSLTGEYRGKKLGT